MRFTLALLAALALAASAVSSEAATPCRDAKGKFIECVAAKPVQCKDAKGKFAKCGSPGAVRVKPK